MRWHRSGKTLVLKSLPGSLHEFRWQRDTVCKPEKGYIPSLGDSADLVVTGGRGDHLTAERLGLGSWE